MKCISIFKAVALCAILSLVACGEKPSDARWRMWYDKPAEVFIESLVMGNGQQGAIIYGGVERERIDLNDMTLWSPFRRQSVQHRTEHSLPQHRKRSVRFSQGSFCHRQCNRERTKVLRHSR